MGLSMTLHSLGLIRPLFALPPRSLFSTTFTPTFRSLHFTPRLSTTTGYGDPPEEKIDNSTPTPRPSSGSESHPDGLGEGSREKMGVTDPEMIKGSGGGDAGGGGKTDPPPREKKAVGERPEKSQEGGHGPMGG